jgi:phosphohistidine phosphatase
MRWSGDDWDRPLTDKGRRQSERLAVALAGLDDPPDVFITSPRVRAEETARIVATALGARVAIDPRLAGPLDADTVSGILASHADAERPCLVGHEPDLGELLGELVGTAPIPMRKAALARVDLADRRVVPGGGALRYLVPPDLVAKPARG